MKKPKPTKDKGAFENNAQGVLATIDTLSSAGTSPEHIAAYLRGVKGTMNPDEIASVRKAISQTHPEIQI